MAAGALEASRLKSEFLANMSHELRTPLNAIIGFTEIIHDERLGAILPTYKEFLGDVLQSSQHLLQIINDVLDLSKIEAGRMQFSAELVDVARAVASSIETLQPLAEEKRLRVSYRVEPSMPAVKTDPQRLMQILYNFLSNAIKFTPDRGKIKIRVAPEDTDRFRIEVKDSGIGIDSADLPKLFGEFVQLDTGLQKKYQGTGLGLALTKRIVEAQGGEVGVSSEVGRGSVFYAILPLCLHIEADGPAEPTRPKYSAPSPP
jgi:signal transduction histidine kinase